MTEPESQEEFTHSPTDMIPSVAGGVLELFLVLSAARAWLQLKDFRRVVINTGEEEWREINLLEIIVTYTRTFKGVVAT